MSKVIFLVIFLLIIECKGRWQSVYQKMSTINDISEFYGLLQENDETKLSVHYREVTILAVTNDAINR